MCSLIHKMMGEACLKEDTLMRVLVIGLTRELPLSPADAMDIADVLVARAANACTDGTFVVHRYTNIKLMCISCRYSTTTFNRKEGII